MKLRGLLYLSIYAASLLVSSPAHAETATHIPQIGLLSWGPCNLPLYMQGHGAFGQFVRGLIDLGYRPGQTVTLLCRSAEFRYDKLATATSELIHLSVDVIVANSQPAGMSAYQVTQKVPIVTVISGDPVAAGLARSLAHPGGNVTGVSYYATELTAKRLDLLRQMMPSLTTVGVLANPDVAELPFEGDTRRSAVVLGIKLSVQSAREPSDLADAIGRMKAEGAEAVFVLPDLMFATNAASIAELAKEAHLPSMAWGAWFTEAGCLMSYAADYDQMDRRLAFYVDRILKGATPADLPIEQPTTFKLSINLKTAKALGIKPPRDILTLADIVIE